MKSVTGFIFCFILLSCGSRPDEPSASESRAPKTAEDSLFHEVMEGHDAGMAKMGKVSAFKKQVGRALDSMKKEKRSDAHTMMLLQRAADILMHAETAMFVWMDDFSADTLSGNTEARKRYLQIEKQKVQVVKDRLFYSVELADSTLKALKSGNE